MTVQITSVVRASDTSFNVRWTERRYVNGAAAGLERWTAVVSIVLQTPRTEERLRRNPWHLRQWLGVEPRTGFFRRSQAMNLPFRFTLSC